jgi:hypothetical protein
MSIGYYLLRPPYAEMTPAPIENRDASLIVPRGCLLALCPLAGSLSDELAIELQHVQQRLPHVTILLWLHQVGTRQLGEIVVYAAERGVRCFITERGVNTGGLRKQLTDESHLAVDIEYRLRVLGFPSIPVGSALIAGALQHGRSCRTFEDMTREAHLDRRWLLRGLAAANLGTPAKLYAVLRTILIAMDIMRDPLVRLTNLASCYRFFDDAALRKRFDGVLGIPPGEVRNLLGWEGLLCTGLRRAGIRWPKRQ